MRGLSVARAAVAAAVVVAGVVLVPAQPSNAGLLGGVSCTAGLTTTSFSPGIRFQPRRIEVDVDGDLGLCVSGEPGASGGSVREHTKARLSCLDLLNSGKGTRLLTWTDGTTSVFPYRRTVTNADGQMVNTFTGRISRGKFQGRSVTQVLVINGALLGCASHTGVTSTTGVGTLLIS